jgi:uncharacterized protein (TIGR04255 family)
MLYNRDGLKSGQVSDGTMTETRGNSEAQFPTLKNAPITEALIDIRVSLLGDTMLPILETYNVGIKEQLSISKKRYSVETRFEMQDDGPKVTTPTGRHPDGYLFSSPTEDVVVQARLDGFTISKLRPYEDWPTFLGSAQYFWERYARLASPSRVTRIAVRYLNRIEIPLGVDMKLYLRTGPEIAPGIPQDLASFLLRLVIPDPASQFVAIVTEAVPQELHTTVYPIILDIDVFREIDLEPSNPQLWEILGALRDVKNRIFFETLTERALEAYR